MEHTFCILAYQESPFLENCIQSLLNQAIKSRVVICTSTPNAHIDTIAQKYQLPVKVNSIKKGIAHDWNFALHAATTPYVTLAHQDDIYYPNYSSALLEAMSKASDSLIGFCKYQERMQLSHDRSDVRSNSLNFFVKNLILNSVYRKRSVITTNNDKLQLLKFGSPIPCPAVTYNKQKIGKFSFSDKFSINMDWFAWYELAKSQGSFVYVKDILVEHRIHPESETSKGLKENRRQQEDTKMFEHFWPKPISLFISKLYSFSYEANSV